MIFMIFHDFQDLVSLRTSSHVVDHLISIECLGLDGGAVAAPPARLGRSRTLGVPRGLTGHPRRLEPFGGPGGALGLPNARNPGRYSKTTEKNCSKKNKTRAGASPSATGLPPETVLICKVFF